MENKIQLFEGVSVRYTWNAEIEDWLFSAVDVCNVLAESTSKDPGAYWRKLKQRLQNEGSEVVLNMLAEVTTTSISKVRQPETFGESRIVAKEGGAVARNARRDIEQRIGHTVISAINAIYQH